MTIDYLVVETRITKFLEKDKHFKKILSKSGWWDEYIYKRDLIEKIKYFGEGYLKTEILVKIHPTQDGNKHLVIMGNHIDSRLVIEKINKKFNLNLEYAS